MATIYEPDPKVLPPEEFSRYESADVVPYRRDPDSRTYIGSFGAVYKVSDLKGKVYAIKEIHAEDNTRRQQLATSCRDQILSEIRLLSQCQHRNVLRVVDVYCVDSVIQTYFIVTEPWAPVTLQKFFQSVSDDGSQCTICPWWQPNKTNRPVLQIFHGLIEGIAYLHSKSIFHKDIKPENILLSWSTDPKSAEPLLPIIADLGISKVYRPGASTKYTNSTVQYLAPEQIYHLESGLKADIFAMGCCLLLLFATAHSGGAGLRRVEEVVIDPPGSCQYGREIGRILPVVEEMLNTGSRDLYNPGTVIQSMIHEDPNHRPDAKSLRFQTNTKEFLNIISGTQVASTSVIANATKNLAAPLAISQQDPTIPLNVSGLNLNSHSTAVAKYHYFPSIRLPRIQRFQNAEYESRVKDLEKLVDEIWALSPLSFESGYRTCYLVFGKRHPNSRDSYDRIIKQVQDYVQASTTKVKIAFKSAGLSDGATSMPKLHIFCLAFLTCSQEVVLRLNHLADCTLSMVSTSSISLSVHMVIISFSATVL
jgi:serine/threonine protein kinase